MESIRNIFSLLLFAAPPIVVWLVGIGLALSRRQRQPTQSLMLIVAFCLLILSTLIGRLAPLLSIMLGFDSAISMGSIVALISLVTLLLGLISWVLILTAIFGKNDSPATPTAATNQSPLSGTR